MFVPPSLLDDDGGPEEAQLETWLDECVQPPFMLAIVAGSQVSITVSDSGSVACAHELLAVEEHVPKRESKQSVPPTGFGHESTTTSLELG
jgi:hypothetical protein